MLQTFQVSAVKNKFDDQKLMDMPRDVPIARQTLDWTDCEHRLPKANPTINMMLGWLSDTTFNVTLQITYTTPDIAFLGRSISQHLHLLHLKI